MRILIVGGYGIFGGRLVELIENEPTLTVIVAGRSLAKAEAFCKQRTAAGAKIIPARFDRNDDLAAQLFALKPDIVVDTSGPFQDYGRDSYRLIEACIEQGLNYLDLADGAAFVAGIKAFDAAAQKAGVFVLSGVSSFPVLTALVVRELASGLGKIDTIHGGIAPSPFAGVGENVIRAIAGYAGQPTAIKKDGAFTTAYPFADSMRYTIAPPGYVPLKNILFSLVDVPDLRVLPEMWPEADTVWMGAGPVPEILHRALIGFSWLVRWKILRSLSPIVKLIRFVMNNFRWGEHRGGMFVEITGRDRAGVAVRKSWHLLAEGRHGPLIPCMAVEAVVRKLLAGESIAPGARAPVMDLVLADYDALFASRTIYTGFRQDEPMPETTLYRRILADLFDGLAPAIREMHEVDHACEAKGRATVERGKNPLAGLIADVVGFPKAGVDIPVSVKFEPKDGGETWTRTFDGKSFLSRQHEGRGRWKRLLAEHFGPICFAIALVPEPEGRLRLVLRSWRLFGIPMPMWLCPRSETYESAEESRFHFNIDVSHPLVGRIVHYRGWLVKETIRDPVYAGRNFHATGPGSGA